MNPGRLVEVKSKFGAEFRRFSFMAEDTLQYNAFYSLLERIHMLFNIPFVIQYVEPKNADLLPISNNKNFELAVNSSKPLLRILLQRKGESYGEIYGYKSSKHGLIHRGAADTLRNFGGSEKHRRSEKPVISVMSDFHLVSSILDVDIIPWTLRRVSLIRSPGKQFGLNIRTGAIQYYTKNGYETIPAFFISRLAEDGIAYNTGLLAVNDEIIEVNGIEVYGKSLDQVNDMMVANSSNLIITIRPADQSIVSLIRSPGKQFGLNIRTGAIQYYTKNGYETIPAFFISRLAEDGIAYNTGLLAVNDEIIEVNGIEVYGKSLDQVNDMMVANSSNLIITIRPADQSMCLVPREISRSRFSQSSDLLYGPRKNIPITGRSSPLLLSSTTTNYPQSQSQYIPSQLLSSSSSSHPLTTNVVSSNNHNPLTKTSGFNGDSTIQINEEIESDDDMNVGLITI
ncbi:unnamed protein product [Schistosoma guineensis]|nr:unnamed protein product [Schistosoma guineensis]